MVNVHKYLIAPKCSFFPVYLFELGSDKAYIIITALF